MSQLAPVSSQPVLAHPGLAFDTPVPDGGYRWWYFDGFSDDGQAGFTIILFIGSVFSPYYFAARQQGRGDPEHFCSANVILYGPDRKRWAMTERGRQQLQRSAGSLRIGRTVTTLNGQQVAIDINERCVPWPTRLRGRIVVTLPGFGSECFALDSQERHRWWPIAPAARVEVDMSEPQLSWRGGAYVDSNAGSEPLEQGFTQWQWQRSELVNGTGRIVYDAHSVDGHHRQLNLHFDGRGNLTRAIEPLRESPLPRGLVWRVPRSVFLSEGSACVDKTFEDTPFYTRSRLRLKAPDGDRWVMHESLDLRRFARPWVQRLLPFRMPRWTRG